MTQEPLNDKGPTTAEVMERLAKFLSTPVKNETGDWTDVTHEDWFELSAIFDDILDAKFERDPVGDHTIEFETCHRKQGRMQTVHIPHNFDTTEDLEQATHAISVASGIVEQVSRSLQLKYAEQRRADARKEKMAPVFEFVRGVKSPHATETLRRLTEFVEAPNISLYVGNDDRVWAMIGVSSTELRGVYNDLIGEHGMREKLEDYILTAAKAMGAK